MKTQENNKMLGLDFKLPRIPASLAAAQMYSREMEQVLASVKSTNEIKRIQEILNPRLLGLSTGLKSLELNSEYSRHLKSIHDDNFRIGKELIEQFSNPFGAHTAKIAELQESLMRGTSAKTYRELREILNPSIFAISEAQQTLRDQFTRLSQLDFNSFDFSL